MNWVGKMKKILLKYLNEKYILWRGKNEDKKGPLTIDYVHETQFEEKNVW